jgi:hypothetical protein
MAGAGQFGGMLKAAGVDSEDRKTKVQRWNLSHF